MTLFRGILAEPTHLLLWISWLIAVNSAAVFFLSRIEARWVLGAWVLNALLMTALAELNGYNRLLGLSHVLLWTPLLVCLWRRRERYAGGTPAERWIRIVFVTNLVSLVVDVLDVGRYLVGSVG